MDKLQKAKRESKLRSCRFPVQIYRAMEREALRRGITFNTLAVLACADLVKISAASTRRNKRAERVVDEGNGFQGGNLFWSDGPVPLTKFSVSADNSRIELKFFDDGFNYVMELVQASDAQEYEGVIRVDGKRKGWPASCSVIHLATRSLLVGKFQEERTEFNWCADLAKMEGGVSAESSSGNAVDP